MSTKKTCTPLLQWSKTHAVAWPAKMHQTALIFVLPAVVLLTPWMQKLFKIVENSSQNDHKKYEARCCIGQKHAPSTDLRKCLEKQAFLSLPVLLCSRHGCKIAQNVKFWIRSIQNQRNASKSWKITEKATQKFQSTISNAPKRDQTWKTLKNRKDT